MDRSTQVQPYSIGRGRGHYHSEGRGGLKFLANLKKPPTGFEFCFIFFALYQREENILALENVSVTSDGQQTYNSVLRIIIVRF